jgi:hypothetical protein
MITQADANTTIDLGKYYAILPQVPNWSREKYIATFNAQPVSSDFQYNSGTNSEWIGVEEIRALIREHVDPNFEAFNVHA